MGVLIFSSLPSSLVRDTTIFTRNFTLLALEKNPASRALAVYRAFLQTSVELLFYPVGRECSTAIEIQNLY